MDKIEHPVDGSTVNSCFGKESKALGRLKPVISDMILGKIAPVISGFRLLESRFIQEVNAYCFLFRHEKSGARLFKIAADDPNKLFCITFKTLPSDDTGVPHIVEHSVLNGSRRYPVKSPFDVLQKGSLHTFLNAMTSADHTAYPAASMNLADYYNLMGVYLDAVFHPAMLQDERILKQEGWHYELTSPESGIQIKGVVYNEMKGTFSNPQYLLYHLTNQYLFPDNVYGSSSAGHPDHIPELTEEKFRAFHKKFYHPGNSYIFLYGDADLAGELEFIDREYLSEFSGTEAEFSIHPQHPFPEMLRIKEKYALPSDSGEEESTYLALSFVGTNKGRVATMAAELLLNALVLHESAPLRLALQEAGIGKDLTGWFSESQQNTMTIIVPNANPEDAGRFVEIFRATLQATLTNGFNHELLEGIVNRTEFQIREGDTPQKGLMYLEMITEDWLFRNNPFPGLEYNQHLSEFKTSLKQNILHDLIHEYFLDNTHALLLTLVPDNNLQQEKDAAMANQLQKVKESLSEEETKDLIRETAALISWQQEEDSPKALDTIPLLKLSDISRKAEFYSLEPHIAGGLDVMHHHQFTNGIIYTSLYFSLESLPEENIPYAALLQVLLGKTDTKNHTYDQIDNQLNIHTGGFAANLATFLEERSDGQMLPKIVISSKAIRSRTAIMARLMAEIILHTRFDHKERLKTVIQRHQSKVEANIRQNGMNYAITRASSHFSNRGMFNERTAGVSYYRFITHLEKEFDKEHEKICRKLQETAMAVFTANNLKIHVTCEAGDLPAFCSAMAAEFKTLPARQHIPARWDFTFHSEREAILSSSLVQYVVKSFDFKKAGFFWKSPMIVLNQILNTDWLQNQIRVQGGAYGGFSGITPGGHIYLASYHDPNLRETLAAFDATPEYVSRFAASRKEMTRYILGAAASLDQPKTPSQKGSAAMHWYFEKTTEEMLDQEREKMLATTVRDIRGMAPMLREVLKQNNYCVYGNETRIHENSDLFNSLIKITTE